MVEGGQGRGMLGIFEMGEGAGGNIGITRGGRSGEAAAKEKGETVAGQFLEA